jgi:RES domain-containing protein
MIAWRVTKTRYQPIDGSGAEIWGGRWNHPGRPVVYAADSFAGALLEILAHSLRPRTLPGPHHAARIEIPDRMVEALDPEELPGWDERGSRPALEFGTRWLDERRTLALVVPALPSHPVGRTVIINPLHRDRARLLVSPLFAVPWDERLFL